MKEFPSFFSQNIGFVIVIAVVACVLFGRIWSNVLNWGQITEPQVLIKNGKSYKVLNIYLPKGWTEGWEVDSVVCFENFHRKFLIKYRKEIYVSGDRIKFTDDGPAIGTIYQASYSSRGSIVMKPVKTPQRTKKVIRLNEIIPLCRISSRINNSK